AVEGRDRLLGLVLVLHFYESESAGPAGVAVGHDASAVDGAVSFKEAPDRVFRRVEFQVSYEDILHSSSRRFEAGRIGEGTLAGRRKDAARTLSRTRRSYQMRSDYTMGNQAV